MDGQRATIFGEWISSPSSVTTSSRPTASPGARRRPVASPWCARADSAETPWPCGPGRIQRAQRAHGSSGSVPGGCARSMVSGRLSARRLRELHEKPKQRIGRLRDRRPVRTARTLGVVRSARGLGYVPGGTPEIDRTGRRYSAAVASGAGARKAMRRRRFSASAASSLARLTAPKPLIRSGTAAMRQASAWLS